MCGWLGEYKEKMEIELKQSYAIQFSMNNKYEFAFLWLDTNLHIYFTYLSE